MNLTVIVLRLRRRGEPPSELRPFRAPIALPVLGMIGSALLLADTLATGGRGLYLRLGVLYGLGIGLHALNRLQRAEPAPTNPARTQK